MLMISFILSGEDGFHVPLCLSLSGNVLGVMQLFVMAGFLTILTLFDNLGPWPCIWSIVPPLSDCAFY